jgi:hypothetical protein
MRVLVVGSLPPPDGDRPRALRTEVARLLGEGHTVEVVAPNPVATAHRYLIPAGMFGCVRLATMVGGYDAVVVQVEPGLPVRAKAGRLERALSLVAFSFALRRGHHVVVRLERVIDLPGGPGGRAALQVWRNAGRIVVGGEDQRAAFVAAVGSAGDRAVVSSARSRVVDADDGGWGEGAEASAENVLELVRSRAAGERRQLAGSESAGVIGWDRLAAPGIAMAGLDLAAKPAVKPALSLGHVARSALALADRRPVLRPVVKFARAARRGAYAMLRPARSD